MKDYTGELLGKYRLKARLGNGAFGTVYLVDELLNGGVVRESALKLYSCEATRLGAVEGMFRDCALPAAVLAGEAPISVKCHFVPIYDFGTLDTAEGPCAYVCMELVRSADTLDSVMERNERMHSLPGEDVILGYMRQFFEALALAHGQNVLHRDIKGGNVMLAKGLLRVVDFGMGAVLNRPDAPLKTTITIYAPENFEGRYTAASDIYQAGLMFYRLYTGWAPFEAQPPAGEDSMTFARRLRRDFTFRPGARFPDAKPSAKLDAVLRRCLEYLDTARFQTAGEVLQALEGTYASDKIAVSALANGDMALAQEEARKALAQPERTPEQEARARTALGDALAAGSDWDAAMEQYKLVYQLNEAHALYFHSPKEYNALVLRIIEMYTRKGQAQSARLWERRLKNV